MSTRARLILGSMAALAMLAGTAPASAATAQLVRVSRSSPYAGCTARSSGDTNYLDAEVEPMIAANPANPDDLIGVWQQDRWNQGSSRGLMAGYSSDGGQTWSRTTLPFSRCAPNGVDYHRASDPWVSIGPDGTAYAIGLPNTDPTVGPNAIVAATSLDGGATWGRVRTIQADPHGYSAFNDKESITADPIIAGTAYAVWDRNLYVAPDSYPAPAMFSKTTDGGRHWSTPKVIVHTSHSDSTLNNIVVVNPITGTLFDFYTLFPTSGQPSVRFVKSRDAGDTWSASHFVVPLDSLGVYDPVSLILQRTADFGAQVAMDPTDGSIYLAWQSPLFNGGQYDEIAVIHSTDGGQTWSAPHRGNTDLGVQAFLPSITVGAGGVLGLGYYDFRRDDPSSDPLTTDYWFRTSTDGGVTFSADQHVAGRFDFLAAPKSGDAHFIGDYMGMTSDGSTFVPFFVKTNCQAAPCNANRTDVYSARLDPLSTP